MLSRDIQLELKLFLGKTILIYKNTTSQDVLKGSDLRKFFEILEQ